jgi:7-keto-8-aminopelargonate synthetase-like enzyme
MFSDELDKLRLKGILRTTLSRRSAQGRKVRIGGRYYLNFSSNDYLGLANHPEMKAAVARAVAEFGTGAGASRLLAGGTVLHARLENEIAGFKSCESAPIRGSFLPSRPKATRSSAMSSTTRALSTGAG